MLHPAPWPGVSPQLARRVSPLRIALTGASGFVGLNLLERLLAEGHEVMALGLEALPEQARVAFATLPGALESRRIDVRDRDALATLVAELRPEAMIVGAAVTPGAAREAAMARTTLEVNVRGALDTLETAFAAGVGRALVLSSASVYGAAGKDAAELDEVASPPQPETVYGICKLAAERLCLRLAALRGWDVRAARIGSVFGPWERDTGLRDTLSAIFQVMQIARSGREVVLPRPGRRDWIYARDVADALAAILMAPRCPEPVYNIGPGREWSVADWCARLAAETGLSWRIADDPAEANVDYHGSVDRPPLSARRLERDFGFKARFGLEEALVDYRAWLEGEGGRG